MPIKYLYTSSIWVILTQTSFPWYAKGIQKFTFSVSWIIKKLNPEVALEIIKHILNRGLSKLKARDLYVDISFLLNLRGWLPDRSWLPSRSLLLASGPSKDQLGPLSKVPVIFLSWLKIGKKQRLTNSLSVGTGVSIVTANDGF